MGYAERDNPSRLPTVVNGHILLNKWTCPDTVKPWHQPDDALPLGCSVCAMQYGICALCGAGEYELEEAPCPAQLDERQVRRVQDLLCTAAQNRAERLQLEKRVDSLHYKVR